MEAVNVTTSYIPRGDGLAVYLSYPNFDNGTLLHDPSIGLNPDMAPTVFIPPEVLLISGVSVASVIAVGIVLVKRR